MNKNNIILIGIVLLFLLVIRPMSKKKADTGENTETPQAQQNADTLDAEFTPTNYTQYAYSPYLNASLQNAQHTAPEGMELQGQTHTL